MSGEPRLTDRPVFGGLVPACQGRAKSKSPLWDVLKVSLDPERLGLCLSKQEICCMSEITTHPTSLISFISTNVEVIWRHGLERVAVVPR